MRDRNEWRSHQRNSVDETPRLSPAHRALIRVCVADESDVAVAIDECFAGTVLDELDHPARELLGLVYRRMVDLDIDHPVRTSLAPSYRRTWHKNQMLLFRARPLLARIDELSGRIVVLKGGAMVSSAYHNDLGVRPLMDLDVLVERRWVEPIVDWALAHGWRVMMAVDPRDIYIAHHAIGLAYGEDGEVDLHWALLVQGRRAGRDRELIASAERAVLGDVPIHVLPPTHQLFHTAAHAAPHGIRHIVDALAIISRHGGDIDWQALVDEVIERRTIAYVLRTFDLIQQASPGTIPPTVQECLARAPRHWSDYAFHEKSMTSMGSRGEVLKMFAADVVGRSRGTGPVEKARVARAMVRYRQWSGLTVRDLLWTFLARGVEGREPREKTTGDFG